MPFGATLQELRLKSGLSQADLANKAGMSVRTIQGWEQGRRRPRADALLVLAKALGVTMEELLAPPAKSKRK